MRRKALLGVGVLLLAGGVLFAFQAFGTHMFLTGTATVATNVLGWLWGGTTDNTLGPASINSATGLGWINLHCDPSAPAPGCTSLSASYGLRIPAATDPNPAVQGYAWSSNVGWLNFQPTGPFPATGCNGPCPTTGVRRVGNNLVGWARFESIKKAITDGQISAGGVSAPNNAGGWEGWVRFSPTYVGQINDVTYNGVQIIDQPGPAEDIRGFAWSNEFGWIQWGGLTGAPDPNPKVEFPPTVITADIKANNSDNPDPISNGTAATITWTSTNAANCSVTPIPAGSSPGIWTGITNPIPAPTTGPLTVNPNTYNLMCTGIGNPPPAPATDSVTVPVVTANLTGQLSVVSGNAATLSWSSENANVCKITGTGGQNFSPLPPNNPNGSSGPLTTTTTFTLTCYNDPDGGSPSGPFASDTHTVTVVGQPTLNCAPASQTVGVNENASFTAQNGVPPYTWSAPGSATPGPISGVNPNFQTSYSSPSTPGNPYIVTVSTATQSDTCSVTVSAAPPPPPPQVNLTPVVCFPSVQIAPPNTTVGFQASGGTLASGSSCPASISNCESPVYKWSAPGANTSCATASYNFTTNTGTPSQCFGTNFSAQYLPPPGSHTVTVTNIRPQAPNSEFTAVNQSDTCDVLIQIEVPP